MYVVLCRDEVLGTMKCSEQGTVDSAAFSAGIASNKMPAETEESAASSDRTDILIKYVNGVAALDDAVKAKLAGLTTADANLASLLAY